MVCSQSWGIKEPFNPCPVELVQLDTYDNYSFLSRDQSWVCDVILFDKLGQKLWSYSGMFSGIDVSSSGGVLGNGKIRSGYWFY